MSRIFPLVKTLKKLYRIRWKQVSQRRSFSLVLSKIDLWKVKDWVFTIIFIDEKDMFIMGENALNIGQNVTKFYSRRFKK